MDEFTAMKLTACKKYLSSLVAAQFIDAPLRPDIGTAQHLSV